jgi:hypothetical protein
VACEEFLLWVNMHAVWNMPVIVFSTLPIGNGI